MLRAITWLAVVLSFAATTGAEEPIAIGSRLEPMLDDALIASFAGGAQLVLQHPATREVAVVHDQPWEGSTSTYHTVLADGELLRMYYRGSDDAPHTHQVVCYAESRDGIHWTKPALGLVEFAGSRDNNIIWNGEGSHNFAPFKDARPDCPPAARYKALAGDRGGLYAFQSPDGIHWSLMADKPVITKGAFDSQNLAFWDANRGRYAEYHREFRDGVRDIMTGASADFLSWTEPEFLAYGDAPAEHLYTNQIVPHPRAPHILIGLPMRFVPDRPSPAGHKLPGVSDGVFMTSRDGKNFRRWGEALIRPGLQRDRWVCRNNLIAWGVLETKADTPGMPDELSIYSTENYYQESPVRLRRHTLRLDGFVAVSAPSSGGEIVTRPITFRGDRLLLNCSTSAAGSVRVELQDAAGQPLAGFALDQCPELYGDAIELPVAWTGGAELAALAGQPVRLRFVLRDADLFAFRFAEHGAAR